MHSLGQRARVEPKLQRPPRCALNGMILSLELKTSRWVVIFCRCFRSIARLSPDRDAELMGKLVLWTTPVSKKIVLDVLNYLIELKQLGELKDKSSIWYSSFSMGCLVLRVEARWYLLCGYAILQIFDLNWAIVKSNSDRPTWNVLVWPIQMPSSGEIWVYRLGVSG